MEIQGKQVATRGVPPGYGYFRKHFARHNWTKYWPVKIEQIEGSPRWSYVPREDGNPAYFFSPQEAIAFIQTVSTCSTLTRALASSAVLPDRPASLRDEGLLQPERRPGDPGAPE